MSMQTGYKVVRRAARKTFSNHTSSREWWQGRQEGRSQAGVQEDTAGGEGAAHHRGGAAGGRRMAQVKAGAACTEQAGGAARRG